MDDPGKIAQAGRQDSVVPMACRHRPRRGEDGMGRIAVAFRAATLASHRQARCPFPQIPASVARGYRPSITGCFTGMEAVLPG